jgi:hypothetical protein
VAPCARSTQQWHRIEPGAPLFARPHDARILVAAWVELLSQIEEPGGDAGAAIPTTGRRRAASLAHIIDGQ